MEHVCKHCGEEDCDKSCSLLTTKEKLYMTLGFILPIISGVLLILYFIFK
jgi:hypothetical protein